ncbi:glycosyltransferase family 2 protein [Bacteriovoracales bacterium]|nr:glycosyltransferase family 2 protein [Bacteriovoracales bacterium]
MKLSIVVPCFNEEKNLTLILEKFNSHINRSDIEVILVDNGSTDGSQKVFEEQIPRYSFARLVRIENNIGYGHGILAGLKNAKGEFLGWTHADLQTDPKDVLRALEKIEEKGNAKSLFIKGKRKGRPFFDEFFTKGMSLFESLYLKKALWDINAQPNIFHKSFFDTWENPPNDFSLDLYSLFLAKKKKMDIQRMEVLFPPRVHGESSWNKGLASKWKFIKRTLVYSRQLKKVLLK